MPYNNTVTARQIVNRRRGSMARRIATIAKKSLGRSYIQRAGVRDWAAIDAVQKAAATVGLDSPLIRWVDGSCTSLTACAKAFLRRYGQAYGLAAYNDPEVVAGALSSYS